MSGPALLLLVPRARVRLDGGHARIQTRTQKRAKHELVDRGRGVALYPLEVRYEALKRASADSNGEDAYALRAVPLDVTSGLAG